MIFSMMSLLIGAVSLVPANQGAHVCACHGFACVHRLLVVYNCVFVLGRQCVVDDWPSTDSGCPVMCFFGGSKALSADELLPSNWLGSVFQKIWAGLHRQAKPSQTVKQTVNRAGGVLSEMSE